MEIKGIIILGGHVQALGILRILGKEGYRMVILENTKYNIAKHSKYCKEFIRVDNNDIIATLIELQKRENYRGYIVFPTSDLHVRLLSKNKESFSKLHIGTDNWSVVEKCYNKRLTYSIAKAINIVIPDTWVVDSKTSLSKRSIRYPCIIKPAVMHTFYEKFKRKAFLCNNYNDLCNKYEKVVAHTPTDEIIIQEVIPGNSHLLFSVGMLFNSDYPILSFVAQRIRQHPPLFGKATTYAKLIENGDLIRIASDFLGHIGYKGLCEVEFKYDLRTREYKLLEINPRTWKWHSICEKAKIPLLKTYIDTIVMNKPDKINTSQRQVAFRHLITDIPMKLLYLIKGSSYKSKRVPVQYAVYDREDIKPFLFEILYLLRNIIKR